MSKQWRMAFRNGGKNGWDFFHLCRKYKVAAIGYHELSDIDLSRYDECEPAKQWKPMAPTAKFSMKCIAYEMKKGDTIYVKHGKKIVGKGKVLGSYKFDKKGQINNRDLGHDPDLCFVWQHTVPVKWEESFQPITVEVGASQQFTIFELDASDLRKIERNSKSIISKRRTEQKIQAVKEGKLIKREIAFRLRNQAIISAKKSHSNGECEGCKMRFEEDYSIGEVSNRFGLIAHHIRPIRDRKKESVTNLEDLALLCPNCHAVVHMKNPPLSIPQLSKKVRR